MCGSPWCKSRDSPCRPPWRPQWTVPYRGSWTAWMHISCCNSSLSGTKNLVAHGLPVQFNEEPVRKDWQCDCNSQFPNGLYLRLIRQVARRVFGQRKGNVGLQGRTAPACRKRPHRRTVGMTAVAAARIARWAHQLAGPMAVGQVGRAVIVGMMVMTVRRRRRWTDQLLVVLVAEVSVGRHHLRHLTRASG